MSKKSGRATQATRRQATGGPGAGGRGGGPIRRPGGKPGGRAGTSRGGATRAQRSRRVLTIAVVAVVLVGLVTTAGIFGYGQWQAHKEAEQQQELEQQQAQQEEGLGVADTVTIETNKGTIVMEVYPDLMPITVANFEKLVEAKFYDGLTWHRVENWVVQTGDPTGTGMGGSKDTIKLETSPKLPNVRGAVGMARKGNDLNSATSQFYILKSDARSLDGGYAVFGKVTQGMDVIDKLAIGDKMTKVTLAKAAGGSK